MRKRWHVQADDAVHDVEIRMGEWRGDVRVFVDAAEVRRGPSWRDAAQRITFPLGGRLATLVWTRYGRANPTFDLVLDNRSLTTGGQPRPPANPGESLTTSLVLFLGVLAVLVGVLWLGALPELRLAIEGREVAAEVTGLRISTGRSTTYYLRYVFMTANGSTKNAEGRVSFGSYRAARRGDVITVVYVPSAPEIQRPASYDERIWIALLAGTFTLMLAAMAWMLWRAYRSRAISAAVAERGVRTTATIDQVSKGWRVGIGLSRIVYHYDDADGRSHRGTSPNLYVEETSAYEPGSRATIAYDPALPGDSAWIGAADPNATVWLTGAT
jgi:hypothetical protein